MKTTITVLLCCALLNNVLVHAMDLMTIEDIPKLSFEKIHSPYAPTQRELSQSLTFNLAAQFPREINYKIITLMFGGDEKSAFIFFNTPLWYAHKVCHDDNERLKKSSLKINLPALGLLFRMPLKQKNEIMGIITPSFISKGLGILLDKEQQEQIKKYPEEIREILFSKKNFVALPVAKKTKSIYKKQDCVACK